MRDQFILYPNMFLKYNVGLKALKKPVSFPILIFSIQKHGRGTTWTVRDISITQSIWWFLWFVGFWWAKTASWVKEKLQGDESRLFALCVLLFDSTKYYEKKQQKEAHL